ncbi:hypothetical protein [Jeotgalibacillus sp. R-1-5s-1]|uniref:hypothetical protein n=1 Tax=Jeotgalibacillus sp. R-1-5s-1 TaxID=2555897 RepID=UPI00141B8EBF|nr:hypothetical protein [Jeotgalibacillus sp. R-1-5s-1]
MSVIDHTEYFSLLSMPLQLFGVEGGDSCGIDGSPPGRGKRPPGTEISGLFS